jgi:2-dehydro-3-deoxyphosphogluconate aldolase/(4S)-4-hydroxy-2-oxoglutarate aldolase
MDCVYERIEKVGVIPVIQLDDANAAEQMGCALMEGGLPIAEITFRTEVATEAIRRMVSACPDILVGAGTVLTVRQAEEAISAGAKFIVSPGFDKEVALFAKGNNVAVIPGAMTPTEIEAILSAGIQTVKIFPAEPIGGVKMLKALSAPYSNVRFVPTGGINAENLASYLAFDKVLACGGSWMVKGEPAEISRLCKEAVRIKERVRKWAG